MRSTLSDRETAEAEYLESMGQTTPRDAQRLADHGRHTPRKNEQLLGTQFELIERAARQAAYPLLERAITEIGSGDSIRGMRLLRHTARMLKADLAVQMAQEEAYAAEISALAVRAEGSF